MIGRKIYISVLRFPKSKRVFLELCPSVSVQPKHVKRFKSNFVWFFLGVKTPHFSIIK